MKKNILIGVLLSLLTVIVFYLVGEHPFINFDDPLYVTDNDQVRKGVSIAGLLWAFTATSASNWHPITWLSHMLDVQLFGLRPGPHHLVSLFIHVLNVLLLFIFLINTTKKHWQSFLVAALFAIHPLHVESVVWVSERKDVLSGFFFLLTVNFYAFSVKSNSRRLFFAALASYALGLMSKPMLVTLPFLLLLLDFWPLNRLTNEDLSINTRQKITMLLSEKIPFFVFSFAFCIITYNVQVSSGAVKSLHTFPLLLRLSNALVSYSQYIIKAFYPVGLTVLYPFPETIPHGQVAGALVFLIIVSLYSIFNISKYPWFAVGWFWYVGMLVPVIGLVQVGVQSMADRYSYIPLIGIFILCTWGTAAVKIFRPRPMKVFWVIILISFSAISWNRVGVWRDSRLLFADAIKKTTKNYTAHNYLAQAFAADKQFEEAEEHYGKALDIKPYYSEAKINLGVALAEQGKTSLAFSLFLEAVQEDPQNPKINNNLGNIYKKKGQLEQAVSYYEKALKADHSFREAMFNLANTHEKLGEFSRAIQLYRNVIQLSPAMAEAYNGLGVALARNGQLHDAQLSFNKAISLNPNYPQAQRNLTIVHNKLQNSSQ